MPQKVRQQLQVFSKVDRIVRLPGAFQVNDQNKIYFCDVWRGKASCSKHSKRITWPFFATSNFKISKGSMPPDSLFYYYYYLRISQQVFKPDRGDLLEKGLLLGYIVMMVNINKAGKDKEEGVQTVWEEGKW